MADDSPQLEDFGSGEALVDFFRHRVEDIESVSITPGPQVAIRGPGGIRIGPIDGVGMIVNMSDKRRLIKKEDAELLLNDGLLSRLKIKIKLFEL